MSTIVVAGALANKLYNGGEAWVRLNWILGFRRLGYEVFFVEQINSSTCIDRSGAVVPFNESANLAYFRRITEQFGLAGRAALVYENGEEIFGMSKTALFAVAEAADLLVNISGHLTWPPLMQRFRRKAYIDIDPGFTQFWHSDPASDFLLQDHDVYFTIGENIGAPDCPIPTGDIAWKHTRQPVVLAEWPVAPAANPAHFTTIASWRGAFGPVYVGDTVYKVKAHEFRKFVTLPQRSPHTYEIALQIDPGDGKDLTLLQENGWRIVAPRAVTADPIAFRNYVQQSGAEFSVAQGIYVDTHSGWFSDRTVRYLASGKPALVQDTGFSTNYPVGTGLLTFCTLEEAVAGAESIVQDYARHARAARLLAERYFDSDQVLSHLLLEMGIAPVQKELPI